MVEKNLNPSLHSAELGKLWATYLGNTMGVCILKYFIKHCDDQDTKKILENALDLSNFILKNIKKIFEDENFPIPYGFKEEEDLNLDAPRLFKDDFYLFYLHYSSKAGISVYTAGIQLLTRKDIKDLFAEILDKTVQLIISVNNLLTEKKLLMSPPKIPIPKQIDFIKRQNYLTGWFGEKRSLNGLEIGHLYDNLTNDITSKALVLGFSQVTENKKVKDYFHRGMQINHKHIQKMMDKLHRDHLPSPNIIDNLVTKSTVAPFSDKLMLFHKIVMFTVKIRKYSEGASLSARRDIGALYAKFIMDVALFVEDGAELMIDQGWMEQMPKSINRRELQ